MINAILWTLISQFASLVPINEVMGHFPVRNSNLKNDQFKKSKKSKMDLAFCFCYFSFKSSYFKALANPDKIPVYLISTPDYLILYHRGYVLQKNNTCRPTVYIFKYDWLWRWQFPLSHLATPLNKSTYNNTCITPLVSVTDAGPGRWSRTVKYAGQGRCWTHRLGAGYFSKINFWLLQ